MELVSVVDAALVAGGLRRAPVPDGWPEELTYVALHPDPPEPVYGVARGQAATTP